MILNQYFNNFQINVFYQKNYTFISVCVNHIYIWEFIVTLISENANKFFKKMMTVSIITFLKAWKQIL